MDARELVDLLIPEHGRTSCSDANLNNGIETDDGNFRCSRCMLLDLVEGNVSPEEFRKIYRNIEIYLSSYSLSKK